MRDIFVIGISDEEDAASANVTLKSVVILAISKESALKEHALRESLGAVVNRESSDSMNFHRQWKNKAQFTRNSSNQPFHLHQKDQGSSGLAGKSSASMPS